VATAILLFMGTAYQDLLWPFQISYLGSVAGGLGALALLERALPPAWAGRRIQALDMDERIRVVALRRGSQSKLIVRDLVGQEGDILWFAVRKDAIDELERRLAGGEGERR